MFSNFISDSWCIYSSYLRVYGSYLSSSCISAIHQFVAERCWSFTLEENYPAFSKQFYCKIRQSSPRTFAHFFSLGVKYVYLPSLHLFSCKFSYINQHLPSTDHRCLFLSSSFFNENLHRLSNYFILSPFFSHCQRFSRWH